jgi:hypothetical protein
LISGSVSGFIAYVKRSFERDTISTRLDLPEDAADDDLCHRSPAPDARPHPADQ